jgi:hypothetical protein
VRDKFAFFSLVNDDEFLEEFQIKSDNSEIADRLSDQGLKDFVVNQQK